MKKKILFSLVLLLGLIIIKLGNNDELNKGIINKGINYAKLHNLNKNYIIFVDFSKHSGKNRFFVYDINKQKIVLQSLCAHGCGYGSTKSNPVFSNVVGSHCSSLGFYKVENFNKTRMGLPSYILEGLSNSNNNAKQRMLLIHPYYTISDIPTYPIYAPIDISEGCFVISPLKFKILSNIIKQHKDICIYAFNLLK